MAVTLLVLAFVMVGVLMAFALVVALLKLLVVLVLLPLRVGLHLAVFPVKAVIALLLFPLAVLGALFGGLGMFGFHAHLWPLAVVALAVWVMIKRGQARRAV